jgi:DNA-binding CsgD family transcriptional regulator
LEENTFILYMPADNALTRREREVLDLIGQGKTSKQIAGSLNLSVYTVNNHRKHICKKVGLHSTAQLVAFAVIQSQSHKLSG